MGNTKASVLDELFTQILAIFNNFLKATTVHIFYGNISSVVPKVDFMGFHHIIALNQMIKFVLF